METHIAVNRPTAPVVPPTEVRVTLTMSEAEARDFLRQGSESSRGFKDNLRARIREALQGAGIVIPTGERAEREVR